MATAPKKNTAAKKTTARKPAPKGAAKRNPKTPAQEKRTNMRNVGLSCSVKSCTHAAKRRGLCSGKGSENHYRKALHPERTPA